MKQVTLTSSLVLALMLGAGNALAAPADETTDPALEQNRVQAQQQNRERKQLNQDGASETGDQTRDRTRDRLHDGSGDGDQTRDQERKRLHNEDGSGDMNRNRFENRRMDSHRDAGTGAGRR